MKITASTQLYAVLGNPVRQSLSPVLQNGWINEHGFDAVYTAITIKQENFETALLGLHQCGLMGANVTMPFKERAAAYAYALSERAAATSSVNCLTFHDSGFIGNSTDGDGFVADLDARAPNWREMSGTTLVIGAGGAARAILYALVDMGRTNIAVVNRDRKRADEAVSLHPADSVKSIDWSALSEHLSGASLVVNATSAGFKGQNDLSLDMSQTDPDCIIYDTIYAPKETLFLLDARQHRRRTLNGLGMLVGQGALAFEHWFGVRPDLMKGLARLEAELSS